MSDYLNPALTELKQAIIAAWPSLVKNDGGLKLIEAGHVAAIPFEELATVHGLPYGVLIASEEQPAGIDAAETYGMLDIEVLFFAETPGKPTLLRTRGQELRDYLWPDDPLTLSQVWTRPGISHSLTKGANLFLRAKKLPVLSVSVSFRLLTGEPAEL